MLTSALKRVGSAEFSDGDEGCGGGSGSFEVEGIPMMDCQIVLSLHVQGRE